MADEKITDYAENSDPQSTDLFEIVDDPGGTPECQKITLANLALGVGLGALTDWTPTVTQSGSVSITITYAKYCTIGPLTYICANIAITGAGTGNNNIAIGGIPNDPASNGDYGNIWINDNGTAYRVGAAIYVGSSQFLCRIDGAGTAGVNPNFALASGDAILMHALYPTS